MKREKWTPPAMRVDLKKLDTTQREKLEAALRDGPVRLSQLSEELLSALGNGLTGFAQTEAPREEMGWKHIPDPPPPPDAHRYSPFHEYGTGGRPPRPFFRHTVDSYARDGSARPRKPLTRPPWAQPWCAVCSKWIELTHVESAETPMGDRVFVVRCHGQREESRVLHAELVKIAAWGLKGYGVAFGGAW